jgi:hypothetical protein
MNFIGGEHFTDWHFSWQISPTLSKSQRSVQFWHHGHGIGWHSLLDVEESREIGLQRTGSRLHLIELRIRRSVADQPSRRDCRGKQRTDDRGRLNATGESIRSARRAARSSGKS